MPNELSEKVYPDGTVVKLRDDAARESIADLVSEKADRLVSSSNGTTQTFNIPAAVANRMYLLSAGYSSQYSDNYVFGLILINSSGTIKYVSLKDTSITVSATYTNGIVTLTFSNQVYSNAVLIRLS